MTEEQGVARGCDNDDNHLSKEEDESSSKDEDKQDSASCSSTFMKDYLVRVKEEFLLPKPKLVPLPPPQAQEGDEKEGKKAAADNKEKKGKKRPRDARPQGMEKLCAKTRRGEECPFGENCRFSHDVASYLKTKEPDITTLTCPEYSNFGFCSSGFMCRMGDCHIDKEKCINLQRPEEEGGVIERVHINMLSKELQTALRKKNYEYQPPENYNLTPYAEKTVKLVDFSNKVYVAPLTTIGNLPWRRIMKDFGADITCGEMAMVQNLQTGQPSEWALLRKHESESCFGVQVACAQPDQMNRFAKVLEHEVEADFVDLNCGCPIDVICNRGAGSKLMTRPRKLVDMVAAMGRQLLSKSVTVKIRTGWDDKAPTAHKLLPELQQMRFKSGKGIAAVFIHGRSRLQRYTRLADWEYVLQAARAQDPTKPMIPVIGNGDILSYEDWVGHRHLLRENLQDGEEHEFSYGLTNCAMLGRGAIIKPWLPTEIHEQRHWDISASERFDMYKRFCNYGLEHWGSDTQGINTTRRFLLEWLSFTHRYVPVGLLENPPQRLVQKPPNYRGREDLETLLSSPYSQDWVEIARRLLGPLPEGFQFVPKHKSNSYSTPVEG